jgi:hypothetical protein
VACQLKLVFVNFTKAVMCVSEPDFLAWEPAFAAVIAKLWSGIRGQRSEL